MPIAENLFLLTISMLALESFLSIDDTMVEKYGAKFQACSKLFDHAAHNGSNYLNGHCFVSIMLHVPLEADGSIIYLSVPLGYRLWTKELSKLELAADMVRCVMAELACCGQAIETIKKRLVSKRGFSRAYAQVWLSIKTCKVLLT